ncbi:MAG: hypothetical protein E7187_02565, partial [Erysipelotrichaceae bacterium]|nr:hypothetical protein [Erysipelotrichaceae bacterium]
KDDYKMQKVKAFVVLKPNVVPDDSIKEEIMEYLRRRVSKWALPYDIEFREDLPKTLVGKVAYRVLEEEENRKIMAAQQKATELNEKVEKENKKQK